MLLLANKKERTAEIWKNTNGATNECIYYVRWEDKLKNHILYDSLYDALEKTELLRQIINQWSLGEGVDYIKGNLKVM